MSPPHRLNSTVFVIGTAVIVALVGLLAALVTWLFHPAPGRQCTSDCPPPSLSGSAQAVTAQLTPEASYTSSQYGFTIAYASPWKVVNESANSVLFQTRFGQFQVQAGQTNLGATQLIEQRVRRGSPLQQIPDPEPARGDPRGAHRFRREGVGELYGGTYYPSSGAGRSLIVRIGIIVASRGGVTLLATAFVPYDEQQGIPLADDIDYAMTEFRWPGE